MCKEFPDIRKAIISTLGYFDLFSYPITFEEIRTFLPIIRSENDLKEGVLSLIQDDSIYLIENFYSLRNDPGLIIRRKIGNQKANEMMETADKVGRFLSQFPFIKGLAISGSLSKNYADHKSDIDHFLITTKNRLWIVRTILFFLRKIATFFGKQDEYCLNYFVDEEELEIGERNIYTAMEIVTLANSMGNQVYENFIKANLWARDYFPNHPFYTSKAKKVKENGLKKFIEKILDNSVGDFIDNMLMRITTYIWNRDRKLGKRNSKNQIRVAIFNKHYTKLNTDYFQERFLHQYQAKIATLSRKLDLERILKKRQQFRSLFLNFSKEPF